MSSLTPTQRTRRALRDRGLLCGTVERFIAHVGPHGIRKDLFGIIDIIALDRQDGIIGIQSCGSTFRQHFVEMTTSTAVYKDTGLTKPEACLEWLKCKGRLELWGWRKIKMKRGGKAMIWAPRVHIFTVEDFQ